MTETGSLEPGGEVPPRQGKCSERRGRDDKQSRAEKHEHERTRGGLSTIYMLLLFVFGNVVALECGRICARAPFSKSS